MNEKLKKEEDSNVTKVIVTALFWWMENLLKEIDKAEIATTIFGDNPENRDYCKCYYALIDRLKAESMKSYMIFAEEMYNYLYEYSAKESLVEFAIPRSSSVFPMTRFLKQSQVQRIPSGVHMSINFQNLTIKCIVRGKEEFLYSPIKNEEVEVAVV